jgi:hypothetical protein
MLPLASAGLRSRVGASTYDPHSPAKASKRLEDPRGISLNPQEAHFSIWSVQSASVDFRWR